ncbi:MAG: hypothetical protein WCV91_06225 [Candidatus Margulisiibacteriota bacterium]
MVKVSGFHPLRPVGKITLSQYEQHIVDYFRFGHLVYFLKARIDACIPLNFSAFSHKSAYRALPKHFQAALHYQYEAIRQAEVMIRGLSIDDPQAVFDSLVNIKGKIVTALVSPYSICFIMDGNDFDAFQDEYDITGGIFGRTVGSLLSDKFIKKKIFFGRICLAPCYNCSFNLDTIRHETHHVFLQTIPVRESTPMQTLQQKRASAIKQEERSLVEEIDLLKLRVIDEIRVITASGEFDRFASLRDLENYLRSYKPIPMLPGFLDEQPPIYMQTLLSFYKLIKTLWDYKCVFGDSPALSNIVLSLEYDELLPFLQFAISNPRFISRL